MKKIASCTFILVLGYITNYSYAQLSFNAEIRPRAEYRHGYKSLIDTSQLSAMFTEQRTRFGLNYLAEKYKIKITLQDVRVWGSQSQLNKIDGLTSIHEAWAEYFINKKFSLQIGRQELSYDDERLLGSVNWTQQARSHDVAVFKYSDSTFNVHAGTAYNQNSEINIGTSYTVSNNYKEFYYLWLNKKLININLSFILINNGIQSPNSINRTRYSQTFGSHLEYKKDKFSAIIRGYYQRGNDASKKVLKAYFTGAEVNYALSKRILIGVGDEIISGQSQTDTAKAYSDINHSFNPLYGTAHKFNGYMDYFYVANHLNSVGLQDLYFKLKYKSEKWWTSLDVHQFLSNAKVLDQKELATSGNIKAMNSNLGTEFDLTFAYNISKDASIQFGYSHLLPTETLKSIKSGSTDLSNNWAYIMFSFKPQFNIK